MFHHRSLAVLQNCDWCLIVHDGSSKGTQNELEMAQKIGKPYKYIRLKDEGVGSWKDVLNIDLPDLGGLDLGI